MSSGAKTFFHKIGGALPPELGGAKDLFLSALVPRTLSLSSVSCLCSPAIPILIHIVFFISYVRNRSCSLAKC